MSEDKVIIVSGGAKGIGRGICEYFLEKSWKLAVLDIDMAPMENWSNTLKDSNNFICFQADISEEQVIKSSIEELLKKFGRIDALVNNGAISSPFHVQLENLELSDWKRVIDVNLAGAFLLSKHCIHSLRRTHGCIINIASTRAIQSEANSEAYAAAKGGLVALTHAMAISLGPKIRVNAISPGWIDVSGEPEKLTTKDHLQHPAGRVGSPHDIAQAVDYLINAQFMTGHNLVLDGGMTRKMIYEE